MIKEKSEWNAILTSAQKAELNALLCHPLPEAMRLPHIGPDTIYRIVVAGLEIAVKRYRRFPNWKAHLYRKQGTPAERSFRAAVYLSEHQVGTPNPIAFFEMWEGNILQICDYLSVYEANHTDFRVLFEAAQQRGAVSESQSLMTCVAQAIARMHAALFLHRDLGSQNIFLPQNSALWSVSAVKFLDLNRGRVVSHISFLARAKDLARIHLTGESQALFIATYEGEQKRFGFLACVRLYQFRFWLKRCTHSVRHPIRALKRYFT